MKTIADMQIGHRGRVAQVDGNDSLAARIMEMGLVPGTEVEMIGVAPLGDPQIAKSLPPSVHDETRGAEVP